MNILDLQEFNIIQTEEDNDNMHIWVETVSTPPACMHCGSLPNFSRYGKKEQLFMDIPIRGKRVGIYVIRKRYKCKECGGVFFEPLESMDDKRLATKRLIRYIETESIKRKYTDVAESVGLNEKTIRNIFHDYVLYLEETIPREFPTWLGIDEIHIIGDVRGVLTDIERRLLYDFTINRTKAVLDPYFAFVSVEDRERVQYVTMDMWKPYKDAVYQFFPNAKVVVDKYHVVKELNVIMDTMRKQYKDGLSKPELKQLKRDRYILRSRRHNLKMGDEIVLQTWQSQYPTLYEAYQHKELFFDIYDTSKDSTEAKQRFDEWKENIPPYMRKYTKSFLTSLKNWETEILNYFDCRLTNAFTEGLNNMIRSINKEGRGYSFDVLRAKILLAYGKARVVKPTFRGVIKQKKRYKIAEASLQKLFKAVEDLINGRYNETLPDIKITGWSAG